jgi:hypothetical protein
MSVKSFLNRSFWAAVLLLWSGSIFLCARMLLTYENTPGQSGNPPRSWPSDSIQIVRPAGKFTLVMLVHPDCPCTEASLTMLERLMAQVSGRLKAYVVFSRPASRETDVRVSSLWRRAVTVPGLTSISDIGGVEIERFGGSVSGQTMVYDPRGRLVFQGGITGARGHEGANSGMDSVIQLVQGESNVAARSPVFGCSLKNPSPQALQEEPAWKKH